MKLIQLWRVYQSFSNASVAACKLCFRPILMTMLCALVGSLPLMLGTGTGSELRQPLGYAMSGGLVVSQTLALFTPPVVHIYMYKPRVPVLRAQHRCA